MTLHNGTSYGRFGRSSDAVNTNLKLYSSSMNADLLTSPDGKEISIADQLADEDPYTPETIRKDLFTRAKRGFVNIDFEFVQKFSGDDRGDTVLSKLLKRRSRLELDLLLSIHALSPILEGTPLSWKAWALVLNSEMRAVKRAAKDLSSPEVDLLAVADPRAKKPVFTLKAGLDHKGKKRYFALPYAYWTEGHIDQLTKPGKVTLLILLRETQDPKAMTLDKSYEQIGKWYGISERTSERGFGELRCLGLMQEISRKANDPFTTNTYRHIWHRWPLEAYSKENRKSLLAQEKAAAKSSAKPDPKASV